MLTGGSLEGKLIDAKYHLLYSKSNNKYKMDGIIEILDILLTYLFSLD